MKIGIVTPLEPEKAISKYSKILGTCLSDMGEDISLIGPPSNTKVMKTDNYKANFETLFIDQIPHRESNFDIIHLQIANSPYMEFIIHYAWKLKKYTKKIVTTIHDSRSIRAINGKCPYCFAFYTKEWLSHPFSSPLELIDNCLVKLSDAMIFHSKYLMNNYLSIHDTQKYGEVIPLLPLLLRWEKGRFTFPIVDRVQNPSDNNIKNIIIPGRISSFKGLNIIIKSTVDINDDYKIIILGGATDLKYENYIKSLIQKEGLQEKVHITGFVDDDYFFKMILEGYMVLVPRILSPWLKKSLEYKIREVFNIDYRADQSTSGILSSVLAMGKAIICSDNRGYAEYIDENRGILCGDEVSEWKKSISYMLENPDKVRNFGHEALKYANKELDPMKISKKHLKVYEKVLKDG